MEFIKWLEDYNLGNDLIDTHHITFFEMIKDLSNMDRNNENKVDIHQVSQFLSHYIDMHFTAEEALMERLNYPLKAEHHGLHEAFTQKVNEVIKQIDEKPGSISLDDLLSITQEWFLKHILTEDIKMKGLLKEFK